MASMTSRSQFLHSCAVSFLLVAGRFATAQTASAVASPAKAEPPKKVSCPIRSSPLSPGEVAWAQHDLPKAEGLLHEEGKATGVDGSRERDEWIRVLLREDKLEAASSAAKDWVAAEPRNSWAMAAESEVQWRKGEVSESVATLVQGAKLDPCNAQLDADYARIERFSGLNASAKRLLDFAHRLDPVDDDIAGGWIELQPRSVRLENLTTYLAQATYLPADDRKSLERWKVELSHSPVPQRCHLVSPVSSTVIPYRGIQDGPNAPTFWGLDVSFNGKARRLEIDTGAHGLVLTRSAANALHLDVEEKSKSYGIGDDGEVQSHISRVSSIKIGALEFADCTVEILEQNSKGMEGQDGLIGGDVFAQFLLTLDFPGRLLKLDLLPPLPDAPKQQEALALSTGAQPSQDEPVRDRYIDPSMKGWTKVFRSGHDLIMPVYLNNTPARLFIVDTGSSLNLISWQIAKQIGKVSKGSDIRLMGISGEVKQTYTTGPLTLTFAGMKQETNGLVGMDTSALGKSTGTNIVGLIGAPTLHQLTMQIDYRDDLMNFSYDPKRLTRCLTNSLSTTYQADCY